MNTCLTGFVVLFIVGLVTLTIALLIKFLVYEPLKKQYSYNLTKLHEENAKRLEISQLYYELIYSVMRKFPNETRHETALRYIVNAEKYEDQPAKNIKGNYDSVTHT